MQKKKHTKKKHNRGHPNQFRKSWIILRKLDTIEDLHTSQERTAKSGYNVFTYWIFHGILTNNIRLRNPEEAWSIRNPQKIHDLKPRNTVLHMGFTRCHQRTMDDLTPTRWTGHCENFTSASLRAGWAFRWEYLHGWMGKTGEMADTD